MPKPNTSTPIVRTVKGVERTFFTDQRYLVNAETGDIEIYHPAIARKEGWSEYKPVQDEIVTTVKDATPVRLQELDEARRERDQALEDLAELQEQFDELVDAKLSLERQNAELIAESQAATATEAAPEDEEEPEASPEPVFVPPPVPVEKTIESYEARIADTLTSRRSKSIAKSIVARFPTVEALNSVTSEELEEIPGIGPKIAEQVITAVQAEAAA